MQNCNRRSEEGKRKVVNKMKSRGITIKEKKHTK
jgi:hypothetical protein